MLEAAMFTTRRLDMVCHSFNMHCRDWLLNTLNGTWVCFPRKMYRSFLSNTFNYL